MRKTPFYIFILASLILCLLGCEKSGDPGYPLPESGPPRLIVSGFVCNTDSIALPGIRVSVFDVREPQEQDILSYNYALTDTAGRYTIIRYRGHNLPSEITVVATDTAAIYQEQVISAPVAYDTIRIYSSYNTPQPYNAFVTADFILSK